MSSPRPDCITTGITARPTGAPACASRSWRRCSSSTSRTASTSTTTADRSWSGPRTGPGSSRWPGAKAGRPSATGAIFEAAALAHLATGVPILTHCEGGTGALEQFRVLTDDGVAPRARRVQPCRQGRRPRLSARAPGQRRVRGVRPVVPLEGRQRHAPAAGVGRRGRPRRPDPARHGRRAARLLPRLRWRAGPGLAA